MDETIAAVGTIRASLKTPSLTARVGQHIEQLILDGLLKPGSRLVEETIARELDISRASVREALMPLEQSGLIERQQRNTRVIRSLDETDVRELYEMWAILESEAALLASAAATGDERGAICRLLTDMEGVSDRATYHRLNLAFHRALVAPCPNRRLVAAYDACLKQVRWAWSLSVGNAGDPERSRREHQAIVGAYLERDSETVRRLCRSHIEAGHRRTDSV